MRKKLFKNSTLYLVLDKDVAGKRILDIARKAAATDIDMVQFRDKISSDKDFFCLAGRLKKIFNKKQVFIINDRVDIARILDADGLHLGQDDLEPKQARKIIGREKILGLSCHNFTQVKKAKAQGLDYIGVGPIFDTPLKKNYKVAGLDLIKKVQANTDIPLFAIGGINLSNLGCITALGARRIAVCRLICKAGDIKSRARTIKKGLPS